jgi:peptidoglycan/LPS O-acetylase OafA/YrhL
MNIYKIYQSTFLEKSLKSLDGLRGISILFVLIGHGAFAFKPLLGDLFPVFGNQSFGVSLFFGLSGFLITLLLLKEEDKNNKISLKVFYIKRFFRIFPPYYFYLFVIFLLWTFNYVPMSKIDMYASLAYLWNYIPETSEWLVGHSWSLAVEEQFYFLWPLLLVFTSRKYSVKIVYALIILSPLIRLGTYYFFPEFRGRISIMLHTRVDTLMFGCLCAFYYNNGTLKSIVDKFNRYHFTKIIIFFTLTIAPFARILFSGKYTLPIGYTIEGVTIFLIIANLLYLDRETILYKALNNKVLRHIGILSYGIYLWQQLFLSHHFELNIVARLSLLYGVVLLSYLFVEYPFYLLRRKAIRQ